jgi:hypothetical protein
MSNQIITILRSKLDEISASYGETGVEVQRNALKEALQYYVLNFIYHHPEYKNWIMYGGSALRICHGLDRMSVDLDFEVDHQVTNEFLENLKNEIEDYFKKNFNVDKDVLTIGMTNHRGLTLKFHLAQELGLDIHSNQVHVKIDLNHFAVHPKIVTENWPQNEYQLSFSIKTYNMSALMASKIAAVFLRGQRGVGENIYEEKGRDIYDLLWYMQKRIIPDLDYLKAKDIEEATDFLTLFNRLTLKILNNPKTDENLKQDLPPLFGNQTFIENWIKNWRNSYMRLLEEYKINKITKLQEVKVFQDFSTDTFSFNYWYGTEDNNQVRISYKISDYWIEFRDGDLPIEASEQIKNLFEFHQNGVTSHPPSEEKLLKYAELFYQKTERYLKTTNHVMLGDTINTKFIRMTADNLNPKEQILLNKSTLISCELDDLLK